jgi:hypothetical protein
MPFIDGQKMQILKYGCIQMDKRRIYGEARDVKGSLCIGRRVHGARSLHNNGRGGGSAVRIVRRLVIIIVVLLHR